MAAAPFLSPTLRVNTFEFSCKMSFLLLDPLKTPGPSTIPHLLGRFVLDRSDPMIGGYAPEDPSGVVERFIDDELIASNGELFVQRLSSTKITAVVRKAIQVAVRHEASSNGDTTIDSVKIIRLRMKQAREAFDALIDADTIRAQVQQLMKRAKTSRAWMITGILIGQDATIETNAESKKIKGVSAALEVPAEVAAAAPALAPLAGSKVGEVAVERRHEAGSKVKGTIEGERVFAVEYWRCESPSMVERLRGGPPIRERGPQFVETGEYGLGEEEEDDMDADDFSLVLSTKPEPSADVGGIVFDC
ncbi:uncharacterized protein PV07_03418 [Cladophialophora immunda]|uniref:Uncharacterized protein n=1 Tax=Cladophialophora immunda TaxID=569365 RepID=A0A0D2CP80_9EURO|nr:uncharacterized protein PV07_03418 [Cladophialophora immunda]KIW31825.1 hypothetical protein PV07_03418 [Cladophialophora immunda]